MPSKKKPTKPKTEYASIRIPKVLQEEASNYAAARSRSATKQIEHWARIGKIAEDNPDLTYNDIIGILEGAAELHRGEGIVVTFEEIDDYIDGLKEDS